MIYSINYLKKSINIISILYLLHGSNITLLFAAEHAQHGNTLKGIAAPGLVTHPWHRLPRECSLFLTIGSSVDSVTLADGTSVLKQDFLKTSQALGMLNVSIPLRSHFHVLSSQYSNTDFKKKHPDYRVFFTALIEQFVIENDPTLADASSDFKEPRDAVKKIIQASIKISDSGLFTLVDPTSRWESISNYLVPNH